MHADVGYILLPFVVVLAGGAVGTIYLARCKRKSRDNPRPEPPNGGTEDLAPESIFVRDGGALLEYMPRRTRGGVLIYTPPPKKEAELRQRYRRMRGSPRS